MLVIEIAAGIVLGFLLLGLLPQIVWLLRWAIFWAIVGIMLLLFIVWFVKAWPYSVGFVLFFAGIIFGLRKLSRSRFGGYSLPPKAPGEGSDHHDAGRPANLS